jgi:hypothetical protein
MSKKRIVMVLSFFAEMTFFMSYKSPRQYICVCIKTTSNDIWQTVALI